MRLLSGFGRLALSAVMLTAAMAASQAQSSFPSRPITMVVPLQAGTASDLVARIVAQDFGERTGKSVV